MHLIDFHPKQPLLIGLAVLLVAVLLMLASAPDVATLDFTLGGDGAVATAPEESASTPSGKPAWATEPLRSPLENWTAR